MSDTVDSDVIERIRAHSGIGFGGNIGIEYTEVTPDRVVVTVDVKPHLHQPYGIVHGGVYCAIVEEVASVAGAVWLGGEGKVVGVNNSTDFLRAVTEGTLTATGTPVHRGRSQQLWRVEIADDHGRTAAVGQVRLANLQ
ncbi:PaaI family thioesterase [Dietzia cinnamea]|uniref:PaaI family thioesterase n=1 Tax=Dietzia cinnamea TaxID=321318 RepID=A0ABV3YNL6_9ACTN|nr:MULTISPECIES: PaaI family thioesterase [Dietzia]KZO60123.1 esterase [Dietzia maris]MBS7548066.1 PaaI family thioesterase [Dietzia massiliensis]MCT1639228.1 PaaI family thioesterase [Dietzia cinnamea]MCT1885013.1 PaaI family thioesterase [Dietzia cinnamea]MCT2058630.1 PaaI family thioesterase [Dietzia cinnamea]